MHNIYYLGLSGERSLPFGLLVLISDSAELSMKKFYNLVAGLISVSNSWFNKCSYWTWISKLPSLSSKERYSRIAQMAFLIFLNISICLVDIRNVI